MNAEILSTLFGNAAKGRPGTHMHVIGSSGTGKTSFLGGLCTDAIYSRHGLCIIDRHGDLYNHVLDHIAFRNLDHIPIYLLDPSSGQWITPYNPFAASTRNISAAASRYTDAVIKSWGATDTNATPRIEEISRLLFHFAIEAGETLPNATLLLRAHHEEVRQFALKVFDTPRGAEMKDLIEDFLMLTPAKFKDEMASTLRRLARFLGDAHVRRFLAFRDRNLDIASIIEEDAILLVNISESEYLNEEAGRAFAAMLMADFYRAAMRRKKERTEKRFLLVLDEFQEYVSPDMARMLDGARGGGLSLILSHQRLGHLRKPEFEDVFDAIQENARLKVCFGLSQFETASYMVRQMLLSDVILDKVKDEIYRYQTVGFTRETFRSEGGSTSRSHGSTSGYSEYERELPLLEGFLRGEMVERIPSGKYTYSDAMTESETSNWNQSEQLVPTLSNDVASRTFYTLTEKEYQLAHGLMALKDRTCLVKFPREEARFHIVPTLPSLNYPEENRDEYVDELMELARAVRPDEADQELMRSREAFLVTVRPERTATTPRGNRRKPITTDPKV